MDVSIIRRGQRLVANSGRHLAVVDENWSVPHVAPPIKRIAPVDELISHIYRGPIEPTPWKACLRVLRRRMGCSFAAILIRPGRLGAKPLVVMEGEAAEPGAGRPTAAEHARLAHLDPLARALERPGDLFTLDEVMSWDLYKNTEFYERIIRPYGIRHQLGMNFSEPSGWTCNIGLMNVEGSPPFGQDEKDFILELLPHLQVSLSVYARIRREESERRILSETLDRLTIGTYFLDGCGRVVATNAVGRRLVEENKGITIADNRLALDRKSENTELNALIRKACEWGLARRSGACAEAMNVDQSDGQRLGILVRAVPTMGSFDNDFDPRAIVYVSDSSRQKLAPERFISRLFGLTVTEATLAKFLSSGMSLAEAAEALGVKENTARTYAKRVFAKVGVNRQAELVRLILTSVALLA
ncbi:helix-turn-helix transcriptional regulator [Phenylobacterium sp.]|uniref:helix-turn-helix transcriptional regulator n=1 Tax=Phenylobacterium sp. TaxID=1871053 RepID=UPI002F420400